MSANVTDSVTGDPREGLVAHPARSLAPALPTTADLRHGGDRISVCICTYKRPTLLAALLEALAVQVTDGSFQFDVVVIDNDVERSAEQVARHIARHAALAVTYDVESERNSSLARNRAVRNATGNLVAFIDDDECPGQDWLGQLHRTLRASGADGVLAPVLTAFPPEAPQWLQKGAFSRASATRAGTTIGPSDARTGNGFC